MSLVLPSTVEELNYMQNPFSYQCVQPSYTKETSKDFANIDAGRFKREYSLPNGIDWNVFDFGPYLNFDDAPANNVEVTKTLEEQLVPNAESRDRSESFSSVASSMEEKSQVFHSMAVKTFNTVRMDSGSTCISSDHSYPSVFKDPSVFTGFESEETFLNLHPYISQRPDTADTTSSISIASSPSLEYPVLDNFSTISNHSEDSFSEKPGSLKRSVSPDDIFAMNPPKRLCESPDATYLEVRKKNNIASKNCRKTRKEKQKEMETRVTELEKEREELKSQIRYLEYTTGLYKKHIESILKPPSNIQ